MLDGTNSTGDQVGMLAAVHVAYKLTKTGADPTTAWTEAEFFGCSYNESLASPSATNPNYFANRNWFGFVFYY